MSLNKEVRMRLEKSNKEWKEREERRRQERLAEVEEMKKNGVKVIDSGDIPKQRCDHPNTIEDSTATFFWIVGMVISLLFKGGWILCIIETIVWLKFITRYK